MENSNIVSSFEGKEIRKVWHEEQWYFSVIDVIEILTHTNHPAVYWSILKKKEKESFTFCKRFDLDRVDGKTYTTDCANFEGVIRILMEIPSPKAEQFMKWWVEVNGRN